MPIEYFKGSNNSVSRSFIWSTCSLICTTSTFGSGIFFLFLISGLLYCHILYGTALLWAYQSGNPHKVLFLWWEPLPFCWYHSCHSAGAGKDGVLKQLFVHMDRLTPYNIWNCRLPAPVGVSPAGRCKTPPTVRTEKECPWLPPCQLLICRFEPTAVCFVLFQTVFPR